MQNSSPLTTTKHLSLNTLTDGLTGDCIFELYLLTPEQTFIGFLRHTIPPKKGRIKLYAEIEAGYEEYTREALKAAIDLIFVYKDVYMIQMPLDKKDTTSGELLKSLGFTKPSARTNTYILERPSTDFLAIFILLGIVIGGGIGLLLHQVAYALALGLACGAAIGYALNHSNKLKRDKILEKNS